MTINVIIYREKWTYHIAWYNIQYNTCLHSIHICTYIHIHIVHIYSCTSTYQTDIPHLLPFISRVIIIQNYCIMRESVYVGWTPLPRPLGNLTHGLLEMIKASGQLSHNYVKSPFLMGKSTISMAMFNRKLLVCQRVAQVICIGSSQEFTQEVHSNCPSGISDTFPLNHIPTYSKDFLKVLKPQHHTPNGDFLK